MTSSPQSDVPSSLAPSRGLNKIFIGNINFETSDQELGDYFAKYGHIVDCVIIRDSITRRSKGFGFVEFEDESSVDILMSERPHMMTNRRLDLKRAMPKSTDTRTMIRTNRLYVRSLEHKLNELSEDDLRGYFGQFGNLEHIVMRNNPLNPSKSYAFVIFDDYDPVDKIIRNTFI